MSATSTQLLNTIISQIQQLTNVYVVKYINTGDRVVDGALTIVINSALILFGGVIYAWMHWVVVEFYRKRVYKETDDPTDINMETFDFGKFKMEDIEKYKYRVSSIILDNVSNNVYLNFYKIMRWIMATHKNLNSTEVADYIYLIRDGNILKDKGSIESYAYERRDNSSMSYYTPIWKYKNLKGEFEYIWFVKNNIYSNNFSELGKLLEAIYQYHKPSLVKSLTTSSSQLYIHEISEKLSIISRGNLNKHRTFDTIYFDMKPQLIAMLDKFKTGTLYPKGINLDNKLGILLYGPPGTGKTGTITAIANYLKRDILMINELTGYNTEETLKLAAANSSKYVIVLDEFDSILCGHKSYSHTDHMFALKEALLTAEKDEKKTILEQIKTMRSNDQMGALLRFFDGIENSNDRIIVATTNYPEKIDQRLMRPGRFDLRLKLGCCSFQMFKDIVANVYPDYIRAISVATAEVGVTTDKASYDLAYSIDVVAETARIEAILKSNISPLELINTLVQTKSMAELLEWLERAPHTDNE